MLGPDGPTGNVGLIGPTGPTGNPGATGNTGAAGAYVLSVNPYTSVESFLITRGTTVAYTGATTNSTPNVTETNQYIEITTRKIYNNRGGYRNEQPFQDADPAVAPSRIYLNNIQKAEFNASIQVTQFDPEQWSRNQCIVGFYRAHASAGNVTANPAGYINTSPPIGKTSVECLIGFRPYKDLDGSVKWKAVIVLEDVWLSGSPSIRYDRELWKINTNYSIYEKNNFKVVVFDGKYAQFYINDEYIGEVRASELVWNVGANHPVGGIDNGSGRQVEYLVHTHPVGGPYSPPHGVQPIFAGAEIRHFHTINPPAATTTTITESTDPSIQNISMRVYSMSCKLTNDDKQNNIAINLSDGSIIGVTGDFSGSDYYENTSTPESVGDGIEILGSSTEGQLNIKGISGTGSLVVSATDNNVSINTIYTSTVGNVYSVGLSADTLMYLKENDLASSTRVKMDGTGDLNFQNQFYLNDSALIKYVGPVKKNQYVGITGAIDNFTQGTTGGIYIDLENGGFYVLNTPIGIAGFTGSFKQNEIISASLLLTSDNIWKFPENVYFEQGENYLTCGKSLLNIFSFDSGQNWYAVVAQRGLDLSYTEKFITTTKTITPVITEAGPEVVDPFGKQFGTTTQKFFASQKINSQNQFVSSGGKTITNVKRIAEFDTCVPALSTGSCCYVKYPENTINCIDYVTKDQCDSFGGQYNPLVSCENSCGFTFGLCCSNGNCIENVSVDECNFFGGNYYAGITCGTYPNISNGPNYAEPIESGRLCFNPCENEKVACCKDGVCIGDNFSRIQCELILGGKAFTGGDCSTVNCCEKNIGRGACCACAAKDLLCFDDLTPAECASAEYDGIFMGEEERCENVNCKCVGGRDEAPEQTAPTFDLVLLNPTIRPNEQGNIQILNVQDAEGGDLSYKVIVKQISPTPEIEFSSTNFEIITNQQITQYTTNSLIQIGTSETKYEIIVSVKDQQNNTTTKSEIVTISTNAPQLSITEFDPIIVEATNFPITKNVSPIIVTANDPDGGSIQSYVFTIESNTSNVQATLNQTSTSNQAELVVIIQEVDPVQFTISVKCTVTDDEGETASIITPIQFIKDLKPVFDIIFEPGVGSDWTGVPNANYPTAGSIGTNLVTKIIIPPNQQNLLVNVFKQLWKEISAGVWETTPVLLEEIENIQIVSQLNEVSIPLGNNISGLTAGIYALSVFVAEEPYNDFNISTKIKAVKITNNGPTITTFTSDKVIELTSTEPDLQIPNGNSGIFKTETFTLIGVDPDGQNSTLVASFLPRFENLTHQQTLANQYIASFTQPTLNGGVFSQQWNFYRNGFYQIDHILKDEYFYQDTETSNLLIRRTGAPVINSITSDQIINPNTQYSIIANVSDADSVDLTYSLVIKNNTGTILNTINGNVSNNEISYTNTNGFAGIGSGNQDNLPPEVDLVFPHELTVSDGLNSVSRTVNITVRSKPPIVSVTYNPTVPSTGFVRFSDVSSNLLKGLTLSCGVTAFDPDGGSLTAFTTLVDQTQSPSDANITGATTLTPSIKFNKIKTYNLTHRSRDNENQRGSITNPITIIKNNLPVIDMSANSTSVSVSCSGYPKRIVVSAIISDNETRFVDLVNKSIDFISWPTGQQPVKIQTSLIDGTSSGTINATFDLFTAGTYTFRTTVTENGFNDDLPQTVTSDLDIVLQQSTNEAPIITPPTQIVTSNPIISPITLNFNVSDTNGIQSVTPSNITSPFISQGSNYNSSTGVFSITLNPQTGNTVPVRNYGLRITATDTCGSVTQNTYSNIIVVGNQGPTVSIVSPINNTNLTLPVSQSFVGNATDPDQTIFSSYNWSISGPSTTGTFTPNNTSGSSTTTLTGLNKGGLHTVTLTVPDNNGAQGSAQININVSDPNPVADAGPDQPFTYATNTTWSKTYNLSGSGTDQSGGSISAYSWRIITNPNNCASLSNDSISNPVVTIAAPGFGTYRFGLVVTDNNGNTSSLEDTVDIILNSDAPPTVSLSSSSSNITLPTNSITLTATTSSDTTTLAINETSGFGDITITPVANGPTTWTRTVSGLKTNADGTTRTYTFTATATDNLSQSVTSNSVSVGVNNQAPTVEVFVPSTAIGGLVFANPYTFGITGFASDPDGGNLTNPQFTSTSVSSGYVGNISFTPPSLVSSSSFGSTFASQCTIGPTIVQGNYGFAFTAKDDEGSTVTSSSKSLTIGNSPPVVTVTSPSQVVNIENSSFNTSIFGLSVSDPNEPINNIRWTVIGVPAGAPATTNYTPFISTTGFTNTDITFVGSVGGTYTVEFFCRDLAGQSDTINNLTVKRNAAPTVSITTPATNPTITLPTNTVSFVASASDVDGSIASYSWSSSPSANVSFSNTSVSNPTVTFGAAGTYTISVVVTDNNGRQSTSASRTVTVNAANLPPTINSFSGNTPVIISSGTASSTLTVNASDPESNPLTYTFSFVSASPPLGGQAAPTITQGSGDSSNTATVTGLRVPFSSSATASSRRYTFRASVSDGTNPAVTQDTDVVVNSTAPVISFTNLSVSVQLTGTSQVINLGNLFGANANDPDGGTLTYQWQLTNFPSGAVTPTLTNGTSITNFQATGFDTIGTYTFRLIATDDEGTFTNSSNVTLTLTSGVVPSLTVPANQVYANNQTADSSLSLSVSNASSTATSTTCGPVTITASATPSGGAPTITPPGQIINSSNNTLTISNIQNMTPGQQYTIGVTATATSLTPPTTSFGTFRLRRNALPSTPAITGNTTAQTGQKITFGINGGVATDPDGSISNYSWKVSPTTGVVTPTSTTGSSLTSIGITFNSVGTFGITYSATDNNSGTSTSSVFSVTITNPPTDPCALQNYSYRASGNASLGPASQRFLYNLIVPNIKVNGTHINATNCTAVANKLTAIGPDFDNGIAPFNDRLAGYRNNTIAAGALKSFCIRMEPPASNSNNTADAYVARPYSNFPYLRSNLSLSGFFSSGFIEMSPYTENLITNGNLIAQGGYKVSRPYDLSLSFDSRTIGSNPTSSDLVQNFLTVDVKGNYIDLYDANGGGLNGIKEAGKFINEIDWLRRIVRTDEAIPFIYRCSCWDNSTDKLVYNNWANYTNSTSDKYNLSCPNGSTRKPISLIVVRYRIEDALVPSLFSPPSGPGAPTTTCHSALDSSKNASLLTTDITAYYASYNNATAKTNGSQQECKLATGSYRLVKYTVNTTNPPSNNVEDRKTCRNGIPGTCEGCPSTLGQSYKYLPYGSSFDGGNPISPPFDNIEQYHWEQVPETCPSSSTACASQLQDPSRSTIERTYAQTKQNLSGTLGLTQFNSWAPPEWICLADCEDPTFHVGNSSANICIFDMIQGCAPPTSFVDETPPITDANGNENLIWIKIYNSEDSTQYECVPVLYDKDVLAQYELCEE